MTAATLLVEARRRAGLTQAEHGRHAGLPGSAIGRWERGQVEPGFDTVADLLRTLGWELVLERSDDSGDLALIRRSLARTPAQRLDDLVEAVRSLDAMTTVARRHRG
jgi:transcriptional regulator with XRE-family HTH domain